MFLKSEDDKCCGMTCMTFDVIKLSISDIDFGG